MADNNDRLIKFNTGINKLLGNVGLELGIPINTVNVMINQDELINNNEIPTYDVMVIFINRRKLEKMDGNS